MTDASLFDDAGAPPKARPVQREWALQRGVARFVKRAVPEPHRFACFDRGAAASEHAFKYEAMRGVTAGEPDTELLVPGLPSIKIELKFPPNRPTERQIHEITLIQRCGHLSGWADSVAAYGALLRQFGAPLLANWETVAQHEDALVAGDVRGREVKAKAPRKTRGKARAVRAPQRRGGIRTADMVLR
jgi:hypothetical protein